MGIDQRLRRHLERGLLQPFGYHLAVRFVGLDEHGAAAEHHCGNTCRAGAGERVEHETAGWRAFAHQRLDTGQWLLVLVPLPVPNGWGFDQVCDGAGLAGAVIGPCVRAASALVLCSPCRLTHSAVVDRGDEFAFPLVVKVGPPTPVQW